MKTNVCVCIMSKDRPLQLFALLESFVRNVDVSNLDYKVYILIKASSPLILKAYRKVKFKFQRFIFWKEQSFVKDMVTILCNPIFTHVMFLVDDTIFIRPVPLKECCHALDVHRDCLGVSLRLGRNTSFCYMLNKRQGVPFLSSVGTTSLLKYKWSSLKEQNDWSYPLEVSSSLYRSSFISNLIAKEAFKGPNSLEVYFHSMVPGFRQKYPYLFCFPKSCAFSAPMNVTTGECTNRHSSSSKWNVEYLLELFMVQRLKLAIDHYQDFIPCSVHQEIELYTTSRT